MMETQKSKILAHLRKGTLTAKYAEDNYGIMRLASRIGELKKDGHDITTEMIKVRTRWGSGFTRVARYRLEAEPCVS
jgi:hypothetical protein